MFDWMIQTFTWWHRQTLSTRIWTFLFGKRVGEDALGNVYYESHGRGPSRRWVVYKGLAEPSLVPPLWHAWLHWTEEAPPTDRGTRFPWEKNHRPNMTGTPMAYHPPGSIRDPRGQDVPGQVRARHYKPWLPEGSSKAGTQRDA